MIGIIYKSKHGSTKKIAKVINTYLNNECILLDYHNLDVSKLHDIDTLVLGIPVYFNKLDDEMVSFILKNQELLISKKYSVYITALFYSEFMHYLTDVFDYDILKNMQTFAGLGGALYYPSLSILEKMILTVMNKRRPVIEKIKGQDIFENFNNNEIEIFSNKIKRIDEK